MEIKEAREQLHAAVMLAFSVGLPVPTVQRSPAGLVVAAVTAEEAVALVLADHSVSRSLMRLLRDDRTPEAEHLRHVIAEAFARLYAADLQAFSLSSEASHA